MNDLLDTHVCIWAITEQNKLSKRVKLLLSKPDNRFWVSKMSLLEITIKLKISKLPDFKISLPEFIQSVYLSGYETLPVKDEHFEEYNDFDFDINHRDPFDRYLIATAHFEKMAIITKDEKFGLYRNEVQIIW